MAAFSRPTWVITLACSIGFGVLAVGQAWTDAPTYDEPTYVAAGLTALTRHDLRVNPQHPPLAKLLAAAPALLLHPPVPRAGWKTADAHRLAASLVRSELASGGLRRLMLVARLVPVLEAIAAAWVLALLAERLIGPGTGWLPASLWLACPLVVGLGHLDGIDVPFTLTALLAALAVVAARREPTPRRVALVGVACGVAVLTRVTGLLVLAAAAPAVSMAATDAVWRWRTPIRRIVVVVGAAWATLAFAYLAVAPGTALSHRPLATAVPATLLHVALPPDWLHGLAFLARAGSRPGPAFLFGRAHTGRWPWFWPATMVAKLPPLTLVALAVGVVTSLRLPRTARRELLWCVGLPATLLTAFALQQERPLGIRYLLPAIALTLVGTASAVGPSRSRRGALAGGLAVAAGAVACFTVPSLAWTTPLAGDGYRVAADSNLDWGQGFNALQAWSPGHRPWVAYFGGAGLDVSELPGARDLRHAPAAVDGWVAVSASFVTDYQRPRYAWLRGYCPVDVLDRTILVYRFASPVIRSGRTNARLQPPCAGRFSHLASARPADGPPATQGRPSARPG